LIRIFSECKIVFHQQYHIDAKICNSEEKYNDSLMTLCWCYDYVCIPA